MYNPFATHKDFFSSNAFRGTLVAIGCIVAALLVFKAGIIVGYHKASYSYRMRAMPARAMFIGGMSDRAFTSGHGAFGRVLHTEGDRLIILGADPSEEEKVVRFNDRTTVRAFERNIAPSDLRADDYVVVVGKPSDDGQIDANFIRVVPPPDAETENVYYFNR